LDGGRVRRVGPHRELWRTEPAYRRVFRGAADVDADAAADAEADAADVDVDADAGAEVAP
ncbi:hypothetical protein, partial [Streptomyces rochei]